jgi:RNA polymerase sigma factor (TIGR02999 family)
MKGWPIPSQIERSADARKIVPEAMTVLLSRARNGDRNPLRELLPIVYRELRRVAAQYLSREMPGHTLQPTALINETFIRLTQGAEIDYKSNTHFVAIAARAMREILVDHARKRRALKRGVAKVTLNECLDAGVVHENQVIALNDALDLLVDVSERKARLVEMRFFGGMTAEEIAVHFDAPPYTIRREIRAAIAWLRREMET